MSKIDIAVGYEVWQSTRVELPGDRQSEDVKSVYVKWGTAHFTFKDGEEWEAELEDNSGDHEHLELQTHSRLFKCPIGAVGYDDDVAYCDGEVLHDGDNDYKAKNETPETP